MIIIIIRATSTRHGDGQMGEWAGEEKKEEVVLDSHPQTRTHAHKQTNSKSHLMGFFPIFFLRKSEERERASVKKQCPIFLLLIFRLTLAHTDTRDHCGPPTHRYAREQKHLLGCWCWCL